MTDETVFETRTLLRYRDQCLHSHTSFLAFAREYESLSIHSSPAVKARTWAIRLAHVWRAFELVTCLQEMEEVRSQPLLIPLANEVQLDAYLLANTPRMLHLHIQNWGLRHRSICLQPDTCSCYVLDGHMKCVRSVCANKTARRLDMGRLGTAVLGCTHTPINGSIYCRTCHDASAVYGVAGDVQVGVMDVATQAEPTEAEYAASIAWSREREVNE